MLEVRHVMSDQDVLLAYLRGLKPQVQQQVMLHNPTSLQAAMQAADSADSTIWFASGWNR